MFVIFMYVPDMMVNFKSWPIKLHVVNGWNGLDNGC